MKDHKAMLVLTALNVALAMSTMMLPTEVTLETPKNVESTPLVDRFEHRNPKNIESTPSVAAPAPPTEIEWVPYSNWRQVAQQSGKPIYVYVSMKTCPPCRKVEKEVFTDSAVIKDMAGFVCVKVPYNERARWIGKRGATPATIFLDRRFRYVKVTGKWVNVTPQRPSSFLNQLKLGRRSLKEK